MALRSFLFPFKADIGISVVRIHRRSSLGIVGLQSLPNSTFRFCEPVRYLLIRSLSNSCNCCLHKRWAILLVHVLTFLSWSPLSSTLLKTFLKYYLIEISRILCLKCTWRRFQNSPSWKYFYLQLSWRKFLLFLSSTSKKVFLVTFHLHHGFRGYYTRSYRLFWFNQ